MGRRRSAEGHRRSGSSDAERRGAAPEAVFRAVLASGCKALKVDLSADGVDALVLHFTELVRWRRRADLTSLTDPSTIATRHFLDSLTLSSLLPRGARVADLGSGAGFPGIPLAVSRPDLWVDLLEAREVKVAFLQHLALKLERPNLAVRRADAGQGATDATPYNAVVARAVSNPASTLVLAAPLLTSSGQLWLMRGPKLEGEAFLAQARSEWLPPREWHFTLPSEGSARRILMFERRAMD